MSFLSASHLSKRYGRTNAVVDVTLEVEAGIIFGLVGPNGAGKSTLLQMLATVLDPTRGEVTINGQDALRSPQRVRGIIGYVPDVYGLYEDTKVWEYLDLFARCYSLRGRARHSTIAELLKLVDLFEFRFAYCRSLSRGMRQRLVIARALLPDPELLLLDEPLAGLDPGSRLEMLEVLRELGSIGKTIVISSHSIGELVDVCDRIGLMAAGQLTNVGTVPELIREIDPIQRARLVVLREEDRARNVLGDLPAVDEIELDGRTLTFLCHGGQAAMAEALERLVAAGIKVAQFGPVGQPLHELIASSSRTLPSIEQSRP
ncbi:MAG: ABC transporter ATP-binding protein [Chloroflexota bacterium]